MGIIALALMEFAITVLIAYSASLCPRLVQVLSNLVLPVIRAFNRASTITTRRINQLIKELTAKAADHFKVTHPEKAERLQRFSAHWLRHLSCSMQDLVEIDKQNIKENAGHGSTNTTNIYIHPSDILRHEAMNKLVWKPLIGRDEN